MTPKRDKSLRERVDALTGELNEAKLRRADAFTDLRLHDKVSVDDARHGSLLVISGRVPRGAKYLARDPEIIRVELAMALKELGVEYPAGE